MRFSLTIGITFIWLTCLNGYSQKTERLYLSGIDKDNTVEWDFFCTRGNNSGKWSKIAVPSNWELQGYGSYNYGWEKEFTDEKGLYKFSFTVPESWKGKEVNLVFEGSMTDTEVKINGKLAGPIHQGAFYRFRYPVTRLLSPGKTNTLEATVAKVSTDSLINDAERKADYWVFGGIYRPVYLEAFPPEYIDRVAIDARSDGSLVLEAYTINTGKNYTIVTKITDGNGVQLGNTINTKAEELSDKTTIKANFPQPLLWSPEYPNLYEAEISLTDDKEIVHTIRQKFGFRTVEVRTRDGIYINGKKIIFRGVCRHSFWPTSGRCTSKELSITDVNLIKDMNMNAVRMSHYPPDQHFLDVCDSLGLFVLDELAGWQYAPYSTPVAKKLVAEMIVRDVNHPSIVMWDNGNEGGFNTEILDDYPKLDIQKRPVIEPWATLNGINTYHYPNYGYGMNTFFNGRDIFFPTEFLHGLYDGGLGAGLDDFWNLMMSNPLSAGGFLWVFADEGIVRRDWNDSLDTKKNLAPDGIVGPYREKEGSFYTIKDIWSPAQFEKKQITGLFDGNFAVSNRFMYTNLKQCSFSYQLVGIPDKLTLVIRKVTTGNIEAPDIIPGAKGMLHLNLPDNWKDYDVLYLSALDPFGRNINTWSWNITSPAAIAKRMCPSSIGQASGSGDNKSLFLSSGNVEVKIDKTTGYIESIRNNGKYIPFVKGPVFTTETAKVKQVRNYASGNDYIIEFTYEGNNPNYIKWTMHPGGWLQLDYTYRPWGTWDYAGITFDYPEAMVKGAKLLANGPYRVWKNRLRGQQFGLYTKKYNQTITGEYLWDYPEFKGYYSNFYAVKLETTGLPLTIVSATEDLYLHLFTPQEPKGAGNKNTAPAFPQGSISVLHGISPIGTKFNKPEDIGPQGKKNEYFPNPNTESLRGTLFFKFGDD
jgi:hypothetical protein